MREVDKHGIRKVVKMALDAVDPYRDLPIHLPFDVDVLVVPSIGTLVRSVYKRESHTTNII